MAMEKFSSQIDGRVLKRLKKFANSQDRSISRILTEAVDSYLNRAEVRPTFRRATDEVLAEHEELLRRLAK